MIDAACRGDAVYDCDFRIVRSDGKIRVLYSCGKVIRNEKRPKLNICVNSAAKPRSVCKGN